MVHCALRKQLGGWQRGEHRDEMGLYPNWDVPGYLRFDLIHQLITTISRRWCGTKAEITAPWRTTSLLTVCVRAYVYDRQAPIKHWARYIWVCLCVCVPTVWPERQTDRQTDRHPAKHCHRCLLNRAVITAQACHVAVTLSLTVTHTPRHRTKPHCSRANA